MDIEVADRFVKAVRTYCERMGVRVLAYGTEPVLHARVGVAPFATIRDCTRWAKACGLTFTWTAGDSYDRLEDGRPAVPEGEAPGTRAAS